MKNTIVLLCVGLFFSMSCTDFDDELNVQIRIENNTDMTFEEVIIVNPDMPNEEGEAPEDLIFTDVEADFQSAYQIYDSFYYQADVDIQTDSEVTTLSIAESFSPLDSLPPGRYR